MKSFQRVLLYMLSIVSLIFAIAVIAVNFSSLMTVAGVIVAEALEIWAFVYLYIPRRLARSERTR